MRAVLARILGFASAGVLVAALAGPAFAGHHEHPSPPRHSAPEIDPAGLGAMATLLAGGTLLMRSRRS